MRLKNPTEISMKRLIKVVKYLFITHDLELYFPTPKAHGQGASHIEVFTDSGQGAFAPASQKAAEWPREGPAR